MQQTMSKSITILYDYIKLSQLKLSYRLKLGRVVGDEYINILLSLFLSAKDQTFI